MLKVIKDYAISLLEVLRDIRASIDPNGERLSSDASAEAMYHLSETHNHLNQVRDLVSQSQEREDGGPAGTDDDDAGDEDGVPCHSP